MSADEQYVQQYYVVVNHEEQYSIWMSGKALPLGWQVAYGPAVKDDCLAKIKELWTDMRPLSLRKHMEQFEKKNNAGGAAATKSTAAESSVT
jgi:MbtH protein